MRSKVKTASRAGLMCVFLQLGFLFSSAQVLPILSVSKAPVIDGNGSDWENAAPVEMVSNEGKARLRFSRDTDFFYALVEVEDSSPLKNGADRPEEMFKGGDTVAFYFGNGSGSEQRVAISLLQGKEAVYVYRPLSKIKKPYTFSSPVGSTPFDYVAPLNGAKVKFQSKEKTGYILEAALPWKALGFDVPPSSFAFDAQVIFSDPGGTQNAAALWLFAREGPGLTIEDLPTEAKLYPGTWGRAELSGITSKPVVAAVSVPTEAGKSVPIEINIPRDGRLSLNILDDKGWILRELVMAEKVKAGKQTFAWDGKDRYGEPLAAGSYSWKALLFDGMKTEFMGSVGNSGRPPYRTEDGLGSMGGQHGAQKSVASDEGGVYMANALQEGPPVMRKIDPANGKALWMRSAGSFKSVDNVAAGEGMLCYLNGLGKKENYGVDLVRIDPATGNDVPMGKGKARVKLEVPASGKALPGLAIAGGKAYFSVTEENRIGVIDLNSGEKRNDIAVPQPKGLARLNEKTLLVCSAGTILTLDLTSGSSTKKVEGLKDPRAVALGAGGGIYVSDLGDSQQIKLFSADGRKLTATWGKGGGKQDEMIPYDPLAFRNVTGLAVDTKGFVWLAESDPLVRRYIKLSGEGKWLEDFYGPVAYNTFGPDLDDFSRIYYMIDDGVFIETSVNYDQYRKDPFDPAKGWHIVATHDIGLGADGKTRNETMTKIAGTGYGHVIVFKASNGKRYFLRLSKQNRATFPPGAGLWVEKAGRWIPCALVSGDDEKTKSWTDQNGDGLIQPEEEYAALPIKQVAWIDRDLTMHGVEGKLSPAAINEQGVPTYKSGAFAPYLKEGESSMIGDGWTFTSMEKDGSVYYISNHGPHRHMSFWDRATENRLVKIKEGKVQWITGKHDPKPDAVEFSTNSGIAGVVDGVLLVQNIEPASYIAYNEDGFVLGDVMLDENGKHPQVGPSVINIESFTGLYAKDPKSGKNVLFAVSSGDDRILEISGPGKTDLLQGSLTLKSGTPGTEPLTKWVIPYATLYGNELKGLGIDGEPTEWLPGLPSYSLAQDGGVVADLRLRRDGGELHLFASVLDKKMMESGHALRFVFSQGPSSPLSFECSLAPAKDEKGAWKSNMTLSKASQPLVSKELKSAMTERWKGFGYRMEVAIPLGLLPDFTVEKEQKFRRDVKGAKDNAILSKTLPDLKEPLYLEVFFNGKSLAKGPVSLPEPAEK